MIGFEGRLPILSATFKRLVPHTTISSARFSSLHSKASASSGSAHVDGGAEADDTTVLVQGLTWADTVDLTPW
jgi:hypothetical protein